MEIVAPSSAPLHLQVQPCVYFGRGESPGRWKQGGSELGGEATGPDPVGGAGMGAWNDVGAAFFGGFFILELS